MVLKKTIFLAYKAVPVHKWTVLVANIPTPDQVGKNFKLTIFYQVCL